MIDPSASSAAYHLFKLFPDTRMGLKAMHLFGLAQKWVRPAGLNLRRVMISRRDGDSALRALVVRPNGAATDLPIVLHLHGGGYAIGTPYQDLALMKRFMAIRPCVFVAPFYRRSFQAPYPAALEDGYDALLWAHDNARQIGGRASRIIVMGESAGGGLAAALCLLARDRGDIGIAAQFPLYAMLDDREENFTRRDDRLLTWNRGKNLLAWQLYLDDLRVRGTPVPPYASPARAPDLTGLPPAVGFVGDQDLFHDENARYFERLRAAGVPTRFKTIPGAYHAVEIIAPKSLPARNALAFAGDAFAWAVDSCGADDD